MRGQVSPHHSHPIASVSQPHPSSQREANTLQEEDDNSEEEAQQRDHTSVPREFQETYHSTTQPRMVPRGK